jgi:hypothetical protein
MWRMTNAEKSSLPIGGGCQHAPRPLVLPRWGSGIIRMREADCYAAPLLVPAL